MSTEVNLLKQTSGRVVYAIDASSANKDKRTGVENYAYHLIQKMKDHALGEDERVILYSKKPLQKSLAELPSGWESKVVKWPFKKAWMQGAMSLELLKNRPSIFFVPSQGLPRRVPFLGYPIVTTIHDIGFKRIANVYDNSVRRKLQSVTKRAKKISKHIFTISEFSKKEIQDVYKVKDENITVTPLSADDSFKKVEKVQVDKVLNKHRLGHNYFLVVGRMEKKKNIEMIVRAFEQFKSSRGVGDPYELVLIGSKGFGFADIKKRIDLSVHKEDIRVLGFVEDVELSAIMSGATAFLFPTWYEGFGIPSLEAMQSGTVLVASDIAVNHEVAGGAAIYVSAKSPELWAKQLKVLVEDSAKQETLIAKGFEQVKKYSWKKTADKTWEVLQSLV
jgi:glycosyltransferase involved in cell wall biosynthesis